MAFKEKLKDCRLSTKQTQKQIAEKLEISPRAYQHYELGTREPNIEMLIKIAKLFNVSIDYLLGRTNNPISHIHCKLSIIGKIDVKQKDYPDNFYHIINSIVGIDPWINKNNEWFWSIETTEKMFEELNNLIEKSNDNVEELIKFKTEILHKIKSIYINKLNFIIDKNRIPKDAEYEALHNKYKKRIGKKSKSSIQAALKKKNFNIALIANKNHGYYDFMETISKDLENHIDKSFSTTNMNKVEEIINAIANINKCKNHSCICIIRGGGDPDELWKYNDEKLLDAIVASKIPIIIGIGHADDKILARLIANHGAINPTAAAIFLNKCYQNRS